MTAKSWRSCRVTINGRVRKLSYSDDAIKKLFLPFLQRLSDLSRREGRRIVIYLAAPADTGKTTLALFLERLSLLGAASGLLPLQRLGLEGFQRQIKKILSLQNKLLKHQVQVLLQLQAVQAVILEV